MEKLSDPKTIVKLNAALDLALKKEDYKSFDLIQKEKKNDKKFLYEYLGEEESDGKSMDGRALNKEYKSELDKTKYQQFWS